MSLHAETFSFLAPSPDQLSSMQHVRDAAEEFCEVLDEAVPDGPDKTYLLRKLREVVMWANTSITRQPDGAPR